MQTFLFCPQFGWVELVYIHWPSGAGQPKKARKRRATEVGSGLASKGMNELGPTSRAIDTLQIR